MVKKLYTNICFLIITVLFFLFSGLSVLFIHLSHNYTEYQHKIYESVEVKINEYMAYKELCGCICYVRIGKCMCYPYTGAIIVSFNVSNDTYFDKKNVLCGLDYNDVIKTTKSRYPENEKLYMYYNTEDPTGGVYFNIDFIGPYWLVVGLFFICSLATFVFICMFIISSC
jgi:uncharacterized membrane protein